MFFFSYAAYAETKIEVSPSVTVTSTYDDNIFLDDEYEESDFITSISPGVELMINSGRNQLDLIYIPSFVVYADNSDYNTVRHNAQGKFESKLWEHLSFVLEDTYLRSEEPLDKDFITEFGTRDVRHTRHTYQRNQARAYFDYQFGPRDHYRLGYSHGLLENEDRTLDDSVSHGPLTSLDYWFTVRNGINAEYEYTRVNYNRDDHLQASDDFQQHQGNIAYIHRFNPRTRMNLTYAFTNRQHYGHEEDYWVHRTSIGGGHAFTPHFSINADVGYYWKLTEDDRDDEGIYFDLGMQKSFEHWNISASVRAGWDDEYLNTEENRFTEYWGVSGKAEYIINQDLKAYLQAGYRNEDEENGDDPDNYRGECGVRWQFHPYFFLKGSYTYREKQSKNSEDEFTDNQVMLQIGYSQSFKWN